MVHQPARSSNDDIRTLTQACLLTTTIQSTLMVRYAHEHSHTAHNVCMLPVARQNSTLVCFARAFPTECT